jgi:hypothetical protein
MHWQSDHLTTRLEPIHTRLDLNRVRMLLSVELPLSSCEFTKPCTKPTIPSLLFHSVHEICRLQIGTDIKHFLACFAIRAVITCITGQSLK